MRHLYIVPAGFHHAYGHLMDNYHALDINGGTEVVVSCKFSNDDSQNLWESMNAVTALPSEYDPAPLDPAIVGKLAEHGVQHGHTAKDARKALRLKHPQM